MLSPLRVTHDTTYRVFGNNKHVRPYNPDLLFLKSYQIFPFSLSKNIVSFRTPSRRYFIIELFYSVRMTMGRHMRDSDKSRQLSTH